MDNSTNNNLSTEKAYRAMLAFLESYYESTKSDEVGGMLGGMSLNSDGKPMDPGYWSEWINAVRIALETSDD